MSTFRLFIRIRNNLLHYNINIESGWENKNQFINEMFIEIKRHLDQVIVNNPDCVGDWEVNLKTIRIDSKNMKSNFSVLISEITDFSIKYC